VTAAGNHAQSLELGEIYLEYITIERGAADDDACGGASDWRNPTLHRSNEVGRGANDEPKRSSSFSGIAGKHGDEVRIEHLRVVDEHEAPWRRRNGLLELRGRVQQRAGHVASPNPGCGYPDAKHGNAKPRSTHLLSNRCQHRRTAPARRADDERALPLVQHERCGLKLSLANGKRNDQATFGLGRRRQLVEHQTLRERAHRHRPEVSARRGLVGDFVHIWRFDQLHRSPTQRVDGPHRRELDNLSCLETQREEASVIGQTHRQALRNLLQ